MRQPADAGRKIGKGTRPGIAQGREERTIGKGTTSVVPHKLQKDAALAAEATGGYEMCLAVPGKVVEIIDDGDIAFRRGRVDFGGIRKEINLAYVPEAEVGKYVLVHVGFAISVIDEDEAQRVFKYLEEMGGLQEELGEIPQ
jgi:hydrogenase expression/formation protein HypC